MRYELLLQPPPGEPLDERRALEALEARKPLVDGNPQEWRLSRGAIEVRRLQEAGKVVALELHAPLADSDALVRELVREGALAAVAAGLVLYDPQLNRALTDKDEESVAEHFGRTARYAGEFLGGPGLTGLGVPPPATGIKPGTKVLLGLIAFVVGLLWLSEAIVNRLAHR